MTQIISQPKGYISGTDPLGISNATPLVLPAKTREKNYNTRFLDELFYTIESKSGTTIVAQTAGSKTTNVASRATANASNFKGQLNLPPDLGEKFQKTASAGLDVIAKAGGAAAGLAGALLGGNKKAIGSLINLTQTAATQASLVFEEAVPTLLPAAQRFAALLPGTRLPGAPDSPTRSLPIDVGESLRQQGEALFNEVAPELTKIADGFAQNAATAASEVSSFLSSSQLKEKARLDFAKIRELSQAKGALGDTESLVQALGGAASLAVKLAPVAIQATAGLQRAAGAALAQVFKSGGAVETSLLGFANTASNIVSVVGPNLEQIVTELEPGVASVVNQATAQAQEVIRNLPISPEALSELPKTLIESTKEKLAFAALAGSGAFRNVPANVPTNVGSILVEFQGLSKEILGAAKSAKQAAAKKAAGIIDI